MAGATATESREILISNLLKLFPRKRHDRGYDGPLGIPLPLRHTGEQTHRSAAAGRTRVRRAFSVNPFSPSFAGRAGKAS